jgi:hypothetical protein
MLRQTNLLSGLLFIVLGLAFGLVATGYRFGTPAAMGAGFLPVSLAVILSALGLAIVVQSHLRAAEPVDWGSFWPLGVVVGSIVLFAVALRPLGFAGACFVTVLVSSFAGPRVSWLQRLVPAIILAAVASVVFAQLLGLPVPLWPSFAW